ncbi:hypothetical protein C4K04_4758 [Pseudomonas chlororaphis]|uniref:Uncharacterized protein n=1 Tax=Pseudomonas chlororaphis TaxID=587753 RepID=A0A3G7TTI9_9PSED|nr:hypothetical protein [Pseudomonas chlororaphis]AZE50413.1 hypothetical protein C4K04_4758 [Pseudomonas chlororaphis]
MCITFQCTLEKNTATMLSSEQDHAVILQRRDFERLVNRRQQAKFATATRIAGSMFEYFSINERVSEIGGNPADLPLVICNRYANWDFVADAMSKSVARTLDNVNSYVATAWFPATIQGYLTIEYHNHGEAITIATRDNEMICATIKSLQSTKSNALILGTFECLPGTIGGSNVAGNRPKAFGAISLISNDDCLDKIHAAVQKHQEMYHDFDA